MIFTNRFSVSFFGTADLLERKKNLMQTRKVIASAASLQLSSIGCLHTHKNQKEVQSVIFIINHEKGKCVKRNGPI